MDEGVQVVGGQDEAVSSAEVAPAAQQEVPTQAVLQGAGEVLVEDRVQVVVVRAWRDGDTRTKALVLDSSFSNKGQFQINDLTWVSVQLRGQAGVGVIHPLGAADTENNHQKKPPKNRSTTEKM